MGFEQLWRPMLPETSISILFIRGFYALMETVAPETSTFILFIRGFCAGLEARLRPKYMIIYIIHSLDLCYIWMHGSPRNPLIYIIYTRFFVDLWSPGCGQKAHHLYY